MIDVTKPVQLSNGARAEYLGPGGREGQAMFRVWGGHKAGFNARGDYAETWNYDLATGGWCGQENNPNYYRIVNVPSGSADLPVLPESLRAYLRDCLAISRVHPEDTDFDKGFNTCLRQIARFYLEAEINEGPT